MCTYIRTYVCVYLHTCVAPGSTKFDKVVRRELCSIISKGTRTLGALISGEMTSAESNFLLALNEKVCIRPCIFSSCLCTVPQCREEYTQCVCACIACTFNIAHTQDLCVIFIYVRMYSPICSHAQKYNFSEFLRLIVVLCGCEHHFPCSSPTKHATCWSYPPCRNHALNWFQQPRQHHTTHVVVDFVTTLFTASTL